MPFLQISIAAPIGCVSTKNPGFLAMPERKVFRNGWYLQNQQLAVCRKQVTTEAHKM
jgi:hypothetical protein